MDFLFVLRLTSYRAFGIDTCEDPAAVAQTALARYNNLFVLTESTQDFNIIA